MIRVVLESPYRGDIARNIAYARRCVKDSLSRGESPLASHLLYTQDGILDDNDPDQRRLGIEAGRAWIQVADLVAVYVDHGISPGMEAAMSRARRYGVPIELREILK